MDTCSVSGLVLLRANSDVASLQGCEVLDGDLVIDPCWSCSDGEEPASGCVLCGNEEPLTSLGGVRGLREVTGGVRVGWVRDAQDPDTERTGHPTLRDLDALADLERIGGDLSIDVAPELATAEFPSLVAVAGTVRVSSAYQGEVPLPKLESAGDFELFGEGRRTLNAPRLERIEGQLFLHTTAIEELGGLNALQRLSKVSLVDNGGLRTIQWEALPAGGLLLVDGSPLLERLPLAEFMPWSVVISNCAGLVEVDGEGIDRLGGLQLWGVPALERAPFAELHTVEQELSVIGTGLTSLDGLRGLETVGGPLRISSNPGLCQSDVDAFVSGIDTEGFIDASDNADC